MKVNAILFDVQSIQKYIFATNKLRANVGASYIVGTLFERILCEKVLQPLSSTVGVDIDSWRKQADTCEGNIQDIPDILALPTPVYVASIGGGNALVLLDASRSDLVTQIIQDFTRLVLLHYPGLKVGATSGVLEIGTERFQEGLSELYKQLKENQFSLNPRIQPANTGMTVICDYSDEVADREKSVGDNTTRLVSPSFAAKLEIFHEANTRLKQEFIGERTDIILHDIPWEFPSELELLGQNKGSDVNHMGINDIAIVHIDGNNMGAKFRQCKTLAARSAMSKRVNDKTLASFQALIDWLRGHYEGLTTHLDFKKEGLLPIRPIIVGGDDITFICNARIAVQCAHFLMRELAKTTNHMSISSCAGIAIIPTSYPFFRGYEMAEQLCDRAKAKMRAFNKQEGERLSKEWKRNVGVCKDNDSLAVESCWLDFAILHGETSPTLEQFLDTEYKGVLGNMHFGPYQVNIEDQPHDEVMVLSKLLACTQQFNKAKQADYVGGLLAHNKIKELRSVLQDNEHMQQLFLEQLHYNGKKLPHVEGWESFAETLWYKQQTPYVDAIELMDYILPELELV